MPSLAFARYAGVILWPLLAGNIDTQCTIEYRSTRDTADTMTAIGPRHTAAEVRWPSQLALMPARAQERLPAVTQTETVLIGATNTVHIGIPRILGVPRNIGGIVLDRLLIGGNSDR